MRIIAVLLGMSLVAGGLSGCYSGSASKFSFQENKSNKDSTSGKKRTIGIVLIDDSIPHCQVFEMGARSVIEAHGDKVIVRDGMLDIDKQNQGILDLIEQGVDGIIFQGIDFVAPKEALEAAKKAGIPVVTSDNLFAYPDLVLSQTTSDNFAAGRLIGDDMVKKLEYKGEVAILDFPGSAAARDRSAGFIAAIRQYPGIRMVSHKAASTVEATAKIVEKLMLELPNIRGVFCDNDPKAIGAIAAYEAEDKLRGVYVYGVDGSKEAMKLIREGKMFGTVKQDPFVMAKIPAEDLYRHFNGEKITAKNHIVPVELITQENISQYTNP